MSNYDYTDPDAARLAQEAQQHAQDIMNAALETWRSRAIAAHPAAAPLRDYLTADSEAGVLELAKDLSERLSGSQPGSGSVAIPGGSPELGPEGTRPGSEDPELEALRRRSRAGDTSATAELFRRQREQAWGW